MAITHDASSNSGAKLNLSATTGYSHTAGAISNGIVIVRVSSTDSAPVSNVTGVTYGGSAMTQVASTLTFSSGNKHAVSLWYKLNPSPGAAAVVATFSGVVNGHVVSTSTYAGVHQTTPIVTRTNNPKSLADFDTADPSEARVTVDSVTGEMVVAIAAFEDSPSLTGTTAQTSRASVVMSGAQFHGGSDATASGTTQQMSWVLAGFSANNAMIGASLNLASSSLSPDLISVFDNVNVRDGQYDILLAVAWDDIPVQDSPAVSSPVVFNVAVSASDIVYVFEGPGPDGTGLFVSAFDAVTVDDNTATIAMTKINCSVFDNVSVPDGVGVFTGGPVGGLIFDSVLIQEARFLTITLKINCMDIVYVIDGVKELNAFEAVTLAESVAVNPTKLFLSVFEAVALTESVVMITAQLKIDTFEAVTIAESVTVVLVTVTQPLPTVFDDVTVSESVTVLLTKLKIDAFDTVTVTEEVTATKVVQLVPSVFDAVTLTESVDLIITRLVPEVNDVITVADDHTLLLPILLLNVAEDVITVTDSGVLENLNVGIPTVDEIFDDLIVEDVSEILLPILRPDTVSETITVSESVTVSRTDINLTITASDDVTLVEDITLIPTVIIIDQDAAFTEVFVEEFATIGLTLLNIEMYEDVSVIEAVTIRQSLILLSVFDEVIIDERVALRRSGTGSTKPELPIVGVGA